MITVRVDYPGGPGAFPAWRQTPGSSGRWGDHAFTFGDGSRADWWVVFHDIERPITVDVPPDRTVVVLGEPPDMLRFPDGFLAQFGTVLTVQPQIRHPNILLTQPALFWMAGLDYGNCNPGPAVNFGLERIEAGFRDKSRDLSLITSSKRYVAGHVHRIAFAQRALEHFSTRIDVFGRGIHIEGRGNMEIRDKAEALVPYRYHIAIENSVVPHYFTEKLSDAFLCDTVPLYHGCPNLSLYYPEGSYLPIDVTRPDEALALVEDAMRDGFHERSAAARAEAKRLTIHEYSSFAVLARLCRGPVQGIPPRTTLRPMRDFQ